ncbi:MAG: DNA polymerase IV [Sphaerochaetaceae bacterium]
MQSVWFHVDLDAFYAAVEQLDNPALQGKPVIVGGQSNRGVVSACSYEARVYGVHSAMPMYQARRLCPHANFVRGRMERYSQKSRQVMAILARFSPTVQQISIDEAFLDMSGTERLFGKPRQAAQTVKDTVKEESGLTLSVGIGSSRFIAKMASGYDKPDGLCRISVGREQDFVDVIGLKKLWGIGEKTLQQLHSLGITTATQLRELPQTRLQSLFGQSGGLFLWNACRGIDPGIYDGQAKSRSISTEMTFSADVNKRNVIEQNLLLMAHEVMFRAMEEDLYSSTVAIKLRYTDFSTYSAQVSTETSLYSAEQVFALAKELFYAKWEEPKALRLLGVGLYNVNTKAPNQQQQLFDDPFKRKQKLEKTILELKMRGKPLQKASLIIPEETTLEPP